MKKKIAPKNTTQREIIPRNMNLIVRKIIIYNIKRIQID